MVLCTPASLNKESEGWNCTSALLQKTHAYYTEWSQSERGKTNRVDINIYIYIWNPERWQWSFWQDSKGETAVKNRLLDSVRTRGGDDLRECWNIHNTICNIESQWSLMPEVGPPKLCKPRTSAGMRGGRWEGFRNGGTHVYLWPICTDVWQKSHHNYPQLK